jgi:uncharacterized protein
VRLEDELTVAQPLARVWTSLLDVPRVAPCFPGAELGEVDGDRYAGTVRVRVGPMSLEYAGSAVLREADEASRRIVIAAEGRERRGAGLASAVVEATLHEVEGHTLVQVHTDLRITGRAAQFGSVALQPVSAALLGQFAANLQTTLQQQEEAAAGEPPPEPPAPVDLLRLAPRRLVAAAAALLLGAVALAAVARRRR